MHQQLRLKLIFWQEARAGAMQNPCSWGIIIYSRNISKQILVHVVFVWPNQEGMDISISKTNVQLIFMEILYNLNNFYWYIDISTVIIPNFCITFQLGFKFCLSSFPHIFIIIHLTQVLVKVSEQICWGSRNLNQVIHQ